MLSPFACAAKYLSGKEPGSGFWCVEMAADRTEKIVLWDGSLGAMPTQAEIDAALVPAYKTERITAINAECRARLLARFGDPAEQVSRSIGVYGASEQSALSTGIAATVDASNTASDAVTAAATIAEVEAVTVTWPVI
jgi:hypothetical protein